MKKILTAIIKSTNSEDIYQYSESDSVEYGEQWNGDALGYVENLDLPNGVEINGDYSGSISNLPSGAVVLTENGRPIEIYWSSVLEEI